MTPRERFTNARGTSQRRPLRPITQTAPHIAEQRRQPVVLRDSPELDERQVPPVREKADVQLQPRTGRPRSSAAGRAPGEPRGHLARGSNRGARHAGEMSR
jgi:hypothetical protein